MTKSFLFLAAAVVGVTACSMAPSGGTVDPETGTGALGVTPAHSTIDFDIAKRHRLPLIQIIGEDGRMNTSRNDVRIDFFVQIPDRVDFAGRTVNGDVEAYDLGGDVLAVTVNGDIEISTTGFAEAETVNGSIDAEMGAPELRSGAEFSTVNGSITLDLHDDVDADIDANWLNGSFESDLPFSLQGRVSRRSARGTLGAGGPELELSTVNGSIRIR